MEGLAGGRSAVGTPNQAWLCLDLYAALARLDEAGLAAGVRALLEPPAQACPEVRCPRMHPAAGAVGGLLVGGAPPACQCAWIRLVWCAGSTWCAACAAF